jgi:hypothetical protein
MRTLSRASSLGRTHRLGDVPLRFFQMKQNQLAHAVRMIVSTTTSVMRSSLRHCSPSRSHALLKAARMNSRLFGSIALSVNGMAKPLANENERLFAREPRVFK